MFYRTCPLCGCNLDPAEKCDCTQETEEEFQRRMDRRTEKLDSLRIDLAQAKAEAERDRRAAYRIRLAELREDLCRKIVITEKTA